MNRPLGKSKKNSIEQAEPTICAPWTDNRQAGCEETKTSASVESTVVVQNVTRNSETSSAIRSSERRRKMSAPTAIQTKSATLSTATFRSAYVDNGRPASCNARTPSGVGRPTARSEQVSNVAVHTLRKCSKLLGALKTTIANTAMATATHATRASRSQLPRKVAEGGEACRLISLIPQSGEDECGPGRVGKAERRPDARLACRTPDYCSHSFRAARSFSLSHHHSVRASAKRYDREFLATTRDCLRSAALDSQHDDGSSSLGGSSPDGGCLLLSRNLYNKGSSI